MLPPFLVLLLLRLAPLPVVVVGVAGAENGEGTVGVAARALDYEVAIRIARAALVDRVVVATTAHLIPPTVDAILVIIAIHVAGTAEDDVAHAVGGPVVIAVSAIVGVVHGAAADDRHVAVAIAPRPLYDHIAVAVRGTTLVDRVAVAITADHAPGAVDDAATTGTRRRPAAAHYLGIERRRRGKPRQRECNDD